MSSTNFYKEGILCPNCEYGIIRSYHCSVMPLTYKFDGKSRMNATIHMKCPYCGDDILCSSPGDSLTYNYNQPGEYSHTNLKFTEYWTVVDL